MNTARDLAIVALSAPQDHPVEQGDLSLALAGAELLDLVAARVVAVDEDDRLVPGASSPTGDRLLDEAAALLVGQEPYESVEEWLWRRGRGLSSAYVDELERTGSAARARGRRSERRVPLDSPASREAAQRQASGEPVLAALASAAGIGEQEQPGDEGTEFTDDAVTAVLAAVGGAVMELEAVRQQRAVENAAFDNIWRAL
ncbi:GPP34 family phosphoprotein [Streptomyces sp. NPDC102406]|uniref:GOLPH3/VPS74 family protein n=1 Tax=Streptomyces sp. NPDC102406 TaxID=3366171 RepID=UPI003811E1B0